MKRLTKSSDRVIISDFHSGVTGALVTHLLSGSVDSITFNTTDNDSRKHLKVMDRVGIMSGSNNIPLSSVMVTFKTQ